MEQRSQVKRGAKRAVYDRETINDILDNNLLCHVAFTVKGEPRIIPTAFLRVEDHIYLHGNRKNQMMNALLDGQIASIAVTELNGLVLARSGFHHSVNYRSVVVFGKASLVEDDVAYLDAFVNKMAPNRMDDVRPHTQKELNATLVIRVPIEEASAKVRTGPPIDDEEDYTLDIWAGVLPLVTTFGPIENCPRLKAGVSVPDSVRAYASPATIQE